MLVNCVAYQNGKKLAADLSLEEIGDYVHRPDCFVWVALKDPDKHELDFVTAEFDLHHLAIEDTRAGHQSPKIEEYGDSLFAVLHMIERNEKNELEVGEVNIFVAKNYVVSIRQRTKQGFHSVRERCEREPELLKNGSGFVFYALIDTVVDRYFPIVAQLELDLDEIEDNIFKQSADMRKNIEDLYNLKRKLTLVHHAILPLLEAVGKLQAGRVPHVCVGLQDYYRDVADHVERVRKTIESIRDVAVTALQVNLTLINLNENEVNKKLASWGALFAVPTAIAGIYGMNFRHMPELEHEYGYPIIMFLIVIIDLFLIYRFRRAGWL